MIRARAADGSVHTFPDGTPDQVVDQVMRAHADATRRVGNTPDQVRALSGGISLGWADDLDALGAKAETMVTNAGRRLTGQDIPYTSDQARDAVLRANKEADARYAGEHPVQSTALEVGGSLMTPGLGPASRFIGKGGNWGARALRSAGVGGAYGAVAGAGHADDGERLSGAGKGAAVGAALGGIAQPAIEAVGAGVRTGARIANKATGGKILDPKKEAARRLAERLEKDKVTPASARKTTADWRATGASEPTVMDVAAKNGGEATKGLMRGAALKAGEGRSTARAYADRIEADLQDNAIRRTGQLTADKRTPAQVAEALKAERSAQDDVLYAAFQDEKVPVGDDIMAAIDGNAGLAVLRKAYNAADVRRDARAKAEIDALLNYDAKEVSAGTLDLLRRVIRDNSGVQYKAGNNTLAGGFGGRADDLETPLMDVPGFDAARKTHQLYSQRIEALDHGGKGLNMAPDEFAAEIAPETLGEVQVGYRQKLADAIGNPTEGATGVLNRISSATNQGRNLEAAFPGEGPRYQQALANELERLGNARFISPNTGSQTAGRAADAAEAGAIPTSKSGVVTALINKVRSGMTLTDGERAAIVDLGLGSPDDIPALLARIQRDPSLLQLGAVNAASSQ